MKMRSSDRVRQPQDGQTWRAMARGEPLWRPLGSQQRGQAGSADGAPTPSAQAGVAARLHAGLAHVAVCFDDGDGVAGLCLNDVNEITLVVVVDGDGVADCTMHGQDTHGRVDALAGGPRSCAPPLRKPSPPGRHTMAGHIDWLRHACRRGSCTGAAGRASKRQQGQASQSAEMPPRQPRQEKEAGCAAWSPAQTAGAGSPMKRQAANL